MTNNGRDPHRRILVMDDNREIHKDFIKILSSGAKNAEPSPHEETEAFLFGATSNAAATPSFEIDSAFQGSEGLELVRRAVGEKRPYPAAFVDVRMPPGWDGIETISRVWEVDPDLQVIICSAFSDYSLGAIVAKLGRTDQFVILKKPFDVVEVQQLADSMVTKWDQLQTTRGRIRELENSLKERAAELRASRERVAGMALAVHKPAQDLADNTRFLQDSFARINQVLGSHSQWIGAVRSGKLDDAQSAQMELALKAADLESLLPQIPRVIGQSLEQAAAVTRFAGALRDAAGAGNTPTC
jgi:CheY-like chemotaxis protein